MKESEIVREILRLDGVIKNYRSKNKLKFPCKGHITR